MTTWDANNSGPANVPFFSVSPPKEKFSGDLVEFEVRVTSTKPDNKLWKILLSSRRTEDSNSQGSPKLENRQDVFYHDGNAWPH